MMDDAMRSSPMGLLHCMFCWLLWAQGAPRLWAEAAKQRLKWPKRPSLVSCVSFFFFFWGGGKRCFFEMGTHCLQNSFHCEEWSIGTLSKKLANLMHRCTQARTVKQMFLPELILNHTHKQAPKQPAVNLVNRPVATSAQLSAKALGRPFASLDLRRFAMTLRARWRKRMLRILRMRMLRMVSGFGLGAWHMLEVAMLSLGFQGDCCGLLYD